MDRVMNCMLVLPHLLLPLQPVGMMHITLQYMPFQHPV
jgi:hypothetical protein